MDLRLRRQGVDGDVVERHEVARRILAVVQRVGSRDLGAQNRAAA